MFELLKNLQIKYYDRKVILNLYKNQIPIIEVEAGKETWIQKWGQGGM